MFFPRSRCIEDPLVGFLFKYRVKLSTKWTIVLSSSFGFEGANRKTSPLTLLARQTEAPAPISVRAISSCPSSAATWRAVSPFCLAKKKKSNLLAMRLYTKVYKTVKQKLVYLRHCSYENNLPDSAHTFFTISYSFFLSFSNSFCKKGKQDDKPIRKPLRFDLHLWQSRRSLLPKLEDRRQLCCPRKLPSGGLSNNPEKRKRRENESRGSHPSLLYLVLSIDAL